MNLLANPTVDQLGMLLASWRLILPQQESSLPTMAPKSLGPYNSKMHSSLGSHFNVCVHVYKLMDTFIYQDTLSLWLLPYQVTLLIFLFLCSFIFSLCLQRLNEEGPYTHFLTLQEKRQEQESVAFTVLSGLSPGPPQYSGIRAGTTFHSYSTDIYWTPGREKHSFLFWG